MLSMKTKLTIPQCQEILLRAESEQGAKIFGEIAESISELLGDLRFRNMVQVVDERNAALVRLEAENHRLRETVEYVASLQNLFFAECSQAEEIVERCRKALSDHH